LAFGLIKAYIVTGCEKNAQLCGMYSHLPLSVFHKSKSLIILILFVYVGHIYSWDDTGIMKELVYMLCTGIVCFLVLIIGDMGLINELIFMVRKRIM